MVQKKVSLTGIRDVNENQKIEKGELEMLTKKSVQRTAVAILTLALLLAFPVAVKADTIAYTGNGYTLTIVNNASSFSGATRQKLVDTFFEVYPQMAGRFNPSATRSVTYTIDPNYSGVAYTAGTSVVFSAAWLAGNPGDTDCSTHELMHVVQGYPSYNPVWLIEGIADYARYQYGVNNPASGWSLPNYSSGQSYTDSYRVTARFLAWAEMNINNTIVNQLDTRLRNNTYSANSWNEVTGYSVDQLWSMYAANPSFSRAVVQVYENADYSGWGVSLGLGSYTLSTLQTYGFVNDRMSSLRVPLGYKVTLYDDDNFGGNSAVYTGNSNYIGDVLNDKVSSIKVERAYFRIVSRNSGKVLDIYHSSNDDGASIVQWTSNGGYNQQWQVTDLGNGYCRITSRQNGKSLDIKDWSTDDGGIIQQWTFGMTANQQWQVSDIGSGYVKIISRHSGKALDIKDVSTDDGAILHQWGYVDGPNQQWQLQLAN